MTEHLGQGILTECVESESKSIEPVQIPRLLTECRGAPSNGPKQYWVTLESRFLPSLEEIKKEPGVQDAEELPRRVHLYCDEATKDEFLELAKRQGWTAESGEMKTRC